MGWDKSLKKLKKLKLVISDMEYKLERWRKAGVMEAGCDEAGRGPLAGPVYAAAVVLPLDFGETEATKELAAQLDDSKKLTEKQREKLRPLIEKESLAWGIGVCTAAEIDEMNILNASIEAMHRALEEVRRKGVEVAHVIVDGNRFKPWRDVEWETIVKGDGKMMSIAAASILAKTHRDAYMREKAAEYPQYGWLQNKGYPTKSHRAAIAQYGLCSEHRRTFRSGVEGEGD